MSYIIGVAIAAGVALLGRYAGFDRDRAFYPTVLIVTASYYVLFAVIGGSAHAVVLESAVMVMFALAAVAGFKSSGWIVVAALAGHAVFDALRGHALENSGVPVWWPAFCLAFDVGAAACLAWILRRASAANGVTAGVLSQTADDVHTGVHQDGAVPLAARQPRGQRALCSVDRVSARV